MNYWVGQYIYILLTYFFTMFIWPTVVFKKHLKNKSITYWFAFCSVGMVLLVNTAITFLGLLHILNNTVTFVIFHGVFLIQLFRNYHLSNETKNHFRYFVQGSMKIKSFLIDLSERVWHVFSNFVVHIWNSIEGKRIEISTLLLIVGYGVAFYAVAPLQQHSFGFSDMPVHHSWVYGLRIGKIFYDGIYPEAMHDFAYLLSTAFHIKTFEVMVYLGAIHTFSIFISMYLYFRELFHWKYSAQIALLLILIVEWFTMNMSFSFARMENSLPQEFAFGGMFLIPAFLLRYLKSNNKVVIKGKESRFYWDDNLFIFVICLAETITVHFYATGMAFYLCVPIAVILFPRVFNFKRFIPLVAAVLASLVLSVGPMALAYAEGIPLQGSIGWGLSVIQGSASIEQKTEAIKEKKTVVADTEPVDSKKDNKLHVETYIAGPLIQELEGDGFDIDYFKWWLNNTYVYYSSLFKYAGYYSFFESKWADFLISVTVGCVIFGAALHLLLSILFFVAKRLNKNKKQKLRFSRDYFDGYIILPLSAFFFVFWYVVPSIGLPQLIAIIRLNLCVQVLNLAMCVIPIDFIILVIEVLTQRKISSVLGISAIVVTVICVFRLGLYHSNMYFGVMRYNSVIDTTNKITDSFQKDHFTIVSTTDEYYQVVEKGFHEETLDFLWKQDDDHYTIPTPYIFVYVEQHSIIWGQPHEFTAPFWMADGNKRNPVPCLSFEPDISYLEISDEFAAKPRPWRTAGSEAMMRESLRVVMNSKMQKWVKRFQELHPNNISVYYQDKDFTCYMISQNPARLFELAIEY